MPRAGPLEEERAPFGVSARSRRARAPRGAHAEQQRGANRLQAAVGAGSLPRMASSPIEPRAPGGRPPPFWRPPAGALPPGVWFGLTTRAGGASEGPFASLNLGLGVGDAEPRVEENRARVRAALDIGAEGPARVHQEHGTRLVGPLDVPATADGFLVRSGDPWVAVSTADCAAVAIVAPDGAAGTLLHSGWRGSAAGIAAAAVEALRSLGHEPRALRASIGPCLHACCFPVGPEVAALFGPELLRPHPAGRPALDLPGAIARTLREAGLREEAIHAAEECTACEADRFYSHRRDRGVTGRHWGLLRLPARTR